MKILYALLASLLTGVLASAPEKRQIRSPLTVKLFGVAPGSSKVKATITNTNREIGYNLFRGNTVLDKQNVEKVTVQNGDFRVPFSGYAITYIYDNLDATSFFPLGPGETKEVVFDIAEGYQVHNTSTALQQVKAEGLFRYTTIGSTRLEDENLLAYASNTLPLEVDQAGAKVIFDRFAQKHIGKRYVINPTCKGQNLNKVQDALRECNRVANRAAGDASWGVSRAYEK